MAALKNPRHEHFAQLIAKGVSATESAKTVGYSELRAAPTGSELVRNSKIAARITELSARVTEQTVMSASISKQWVIDKLVENVKRSMQETPVLDQEGEAKGVFTYQGNVANKALELLGKELGMFIDRKDINLRKPLHELTEDELVALVADRSAETDSPTTSIN